MTFWRICIDLWIMIFRLCGVYNIWTLSCTQLVSSLSSKNKLFFHLWLPGHECCKMKRTCTFVLKFIVYKLLWPPQWLYLYFCFYKIQTRLGIDRVYTRFVFYRNGKQIFRMFFGVNIAWWVYAIIVELFKLSSEVLCIDAKVFRIPNTLL